MKRPLIHIGYNKTGSTWLQEALFPRSDMGFYLLLERGDREQINRSMVNQHTMHFDGRSVREHYEMRLKRSESQDLVPVISCERFSGDPHSGGYDCVEIAHRLKKVFPEARILIVVREQQSMLLSTYKQYVRAGGPRRISGYFHPPKRGSRRVPMFDADYFRYDALVRVYQELFGKEHVLTLPYEWLRSQPAGYVRRLLEFCELPIDQSQIDALPFNRKVNRGYGRLTLACKRHYNRFFLDNGLNPGAVLNLPYGVERSMVKFWSRVDGWMPASWQRNGVKRLKTYIKKQTTGLYAESNKNLESLTGIPFAEAGYEMPKENP